MAGHGEAPSPTTRVFARPDKLLSAHRLVDGVLFAFREENYASGSRTATTAIQRITLNPGLAPGEFAPKPNRGRE